MVREACRHTSSCVENLALRCREGCECHRLRQEHKEEIPFVSQMFGILITIHCASTFFPNWLSFYLLKHVRLAFAPCRKNTDLPLNMESSIPGTALKTPGKCIIDGIGFSLSTQKKEIICVATVKKHRERLSS